MGDGRVKEKQGAAADKHDLSFLLDKKQDDWIRDFLLNDRLRIKPPAESDQPFATRPGDHVQMQQELDAISKLLGERTKLEDRLPDNRSDELRRLRRDLSNASSGTDKEKIRDRIDAEFPQFGELNKELRAHETVAKQLDTGMQKYERDPRFSMRMQSAIQCHRPPEPNPPPQLVHYDPYASQRLALTDRIEKFYQPRPEDGFETVWNRIKDDSPIVKVNEVLKHLPPIKITFEKPADIAKMALIMAGSEPNATETRLLKNVFDGVTSVEKKTGGQLVFTRDGKREIPAPHRVDIGAGISLKGIELGTITGQLSESSQPGLDNIDGVVIKLDVPAAVKGVAGVRSDVPVRKVNLARDENGWTVFVTVENPVPKLQRKALGLIVNRVPQEDRIKVPVLWLDKDGNVRK